MSEQQSKPEPRRRRRVYKRGIYTEPFHCHFSKGQMEALERMAARDHLYIIDVIREGVNMRCGLKAPGAHNATPVVEKTVSRT